MKPVFIGGCDRSGTTMLGAMIGAHPDCITTPESQFKISAFQNINQNGNQLQQYLRNILNNWRYRLWAVDKSLGEIDVEKLGQNYGEILQWCVQQYAIKNNKKDFKFWIDHTPSNLKYALKLLQLFPGAKFIHIVRDGRAVAASLLNLDWGPNSIIHAAKFWLENVSFGLALETHLTSDQIRRVQYKDILLEPERNMREICDFLSLNYNSKILRPSGLNLYQYTAEQHKLVGKELDKERIYSWKNKLSEREIEIFESITGDLLTMFGYEMTYGVYAKSPTFLEGIKMKINEKFRKYTINMVKYKKRIKNNMK